MRKFYTYELQTSKLVSEKVKKTRNKDMESIIIEGPKAHVPSCNLLYVFLSLILSYKHFSNKCIYYKVKLKRIEKDQNLKLLSQKAHALCH